MSVCTKSIKEKALPSGKKIELTKRSTSKTDASRPKEDAKRSQKCPTGGKWSPRPTVTSMARANMSVAPKPAPANVVRCKSGVSSPPAMRRNSTGTTKQQQEMNAICMSHSQTKKAPSSPDCYMKSPDESELMSNILSEPHKSESIMEMEHPMETEVEEGMITKVEQESSEMSSLHTPDEEQVADHEQVSSTPSISEVAEQGAEKPATTSACEESSAPHDTPQYATPSDTEAEDNQANDGDKTVQESNEDSNREGCEHQDVIAVYADEPLSISADWDAQFEGADVINMTKEHLAKLAFELDDDGSVEVMKCNLAQATRCMEEVCRHALCTRDDVLDWTLSLITNIISNEEPEDDGYIETIDKFKNEGQSLKEKLEESKDRLETGVEAAVFTLTTHILKYREALETLGTKQSQELLCLNSQVIHLKQQLLAALAQPPPPPPPCPPPPPVSNEANVQIDRLSKQLAEEQSMVELLQEKLCSAESQLRMSKARINKLDKQLKETESSLTSLKDTMKSFEDQGRQRDLQLVTCARKAREALKTSELTVSRLTQQRDSLEHRITELNENSQAMIERHTHTVSSLREEISSLSDKLSEQSGAAQQEMQLRELAERTVESAGRTIRDLQAAVSSLERKMPNPDAPTEREINACAEVNSAQEALKLAEENIQALKREKLQCLETLSHAAKHGNEVIVCQKLAAELVVKEEHLSQMKAQIRHLTRNCTLNASKLEQYERHLKDIQMYRAAVGSECHNSQGSKYDDNDEEAEEAKKDLQREIINLRLSLVETVHRNEELLEDLTEKEATLEQQEKAIQAQTNVGKLREELISGLEKKDFDQKREIQIMQCDLEQRMQVVEEVNKQIAAKAEEIQKLFSTLENKKQEILKREKVIHALEEQLRRGQVQRTRQEEKIAALEHELVESGARRRPHDNKRFLFF